MTCSGMAGHKTCFMLSFFVLNTYYTQQNSENDTGLYRDEILGTMEDRAVSCEVTKR